MSERIPGKKVVVVLPAYHAVKTLKKTLDSIPRDFVDDIILVDDASKDGTAELARSLGLKTFVHQKNLGYGGNQKTCYREALKLSADIAVMVHPDFQYDPVFIPEMVMPIAEGRAEAVFGSRMIIAGGARAGGMPLWKYIANISLTTIANLFLRLNLSEYHSGFRAYSKKALETMPIEVNSNNFVFDTQIIAQLKVFNLKIAEIPITTKYFPGASMIGFFKSVEYGFGILGVLCLYVLHNFGIKKERILIPKVEADCRICHSKTAQVVYEASSGWDDYLKNPKPYHITSTERLHGPVVQCVMCDLIYVPKVSTPSLTSLYADQVMDTEYMREEKGRRMGYAKISSYLKSLVSSQDLVDIGSGPGFFLDEARKVGFNVSGIESGNVWVKYSNEKLGLTAVKLGGFEDLATYPDNHYSVITAWDVLEHVDNPAEFLSLIYQKLDHGGIFAMSTPIIDSFISKILREKWHAVIPSHVTYFSRQTLADNLEKVGFTVEKRKSYTRFFSLQYLFNRLFGKNADSFLRNIIIPINFFDEIELYLRKK